MIPIGAGDDSKKPYVKWAEYQDRLPTDKEVAAWWVQHPQAKVGIVTGKLSGLTVIDIDTKQGREEIAKYMPDSLEIPCVKSPHGLHYYFKYTEGIANKARIIAGTDVRSQGGYIIAPSGNGQYTWLRGCGINEISPPEMPEELAAVLTQGDSPRQKASSSEHLYKKRYTKGRRLRRLALVACSRYLRS